MIKLSSSSSSMRNGCRDVGSSSRQEYCRRKGWDRAASAVNLSMGLKVKICSRKSTAERGRVEDEVKKIAYSRLIVALHAAFIFLLCQTS